MQSTKSFNPGTSCSPTNILTSSVNLSILPLASAVAPTMP
eukprot:CAMPEP_0115326668 /NCGR_PEP_ID=MMETSP0270-20121206/83697_1 /TAXON_ID=71861 /ORGANISM="Scrippsiella trochoidea, Strain CCMP3099" /LENGTH=39 /DNA_ID= /DNA_START= /DNA_END= /DNA_ORIENTATION=